MNFYSRGLALEAGIPLPSRMTDIKIGALDFYRGSMPLYQRGLYADQVGSSSNTPFGSLADGIVAIIMDAAHVLLMVGGLMLILKAIFP